MTFDNLFGILIVVGQKEVGAYRRKSGQPVTGYVRRDVGVPDPVWVDAAKLRQQILDAMETSEVQAVTEDNLPVPGLESPGVSFDEIETEDDNLF
jgi:hypothetical protein